MIKSLGTVHSMVRTFSLPKSSSDRVNVIIASTGSVATIKIPALLAALVQDGGYNIIYLPSHTAQQFHRADEVPDDVLTFTDSDEWSGWCRGDEILHVELRKWCHVLLVAPLSAHTLAKLSAGLSDSLVLEVVRAWDYAAYPTAPLRAHHHHHHDDEDGLSARDEGAGQGRATTLALEKSGTMRRVLCCAPAMNTYMYTHPFTAQHLRVLRETLHFTVLGPIEKTLACGDVGTGAMVEFGTLVQWLSEVRLQFLAHCPSCSSSSSTSSSST